MCLPERLHDVANKPPAFQLYARDWAMGTAHLTLEAQGGYLRLLCHQWADGPLPDDVVTLQRLLNVSRAAFARLWPQIEPHFPASDGRRINPRLERERVKQEQYRLKQSLHGAKGGRMVALSEPVVEIEGTPKGSPSIAVASASATSVTTTTSRAPRSDEEPDDFAAAMAAYPKRVGGNSRGAALKQWRARLAQYGADEASIMSAGTVRYAAFMRATDKEGTEYVKMAATFFGRDRHYAEPWDAPEGDSVLRLTAGGDPSPETAEALRRALVSR